MRPAGSGPSAGLRAALPAQTRGVTTLAGVRTGRPVARCPLRPGHPCTLCHPETHLGPQDCPTVALVMDDPVLRAELVRRRSAARVSA
jgi:hypothetical protein